MATLQRINCHSGYKHYQMYHWDRGSDYGNSVFNTTYNFNGGACIGGGFMGGLWGGLGMGLGAGLMNFLFGGMGIFGGGAGMFGGGFPMMNWWGGTRGNNDGAGGKQKIVEKEIKDRDNEVLKNLESEIQTIEKKAKDGTITEQELDTLKKKVDDESKKSDKYHKKEDDEHYELLKKRLNIIKIKQPVADMPEPVSPETVPPVQNITEKNINNLTREEILNLTPEQAIEMLGNRINKDNKSVKVPRSYNELLLAYKTGLPIQFCKNTGIRSNASDNIQGTIVGDIPQLANKKCTIKVQDKDNEHTLEFDFNNKKTTIDLKKNNGELKATINNEETNLKMDSNRLYTVESEDAEYATVDVKKPAMYNPERR